MRPTTGILLSLFLLQTLFLDCSSRPSREPAWDNPIVTGPHDDEGPKERYRIPYQPIVYGRTGEAPLPGLAYSYKLYDWNQDGLIDIVAKLRRGYGIVAYLNQGGIRSPRFPELHATQRLLSDHELGRYFALSDLDGDRKTDLVGFDGQNNIRKNGKQPVKLAVYFNKGDSTAPAWEKVYATNPAGQPIESAADVWNAPRVTVGDLDGDGKDDLVIGYERLDDMVPEDLKSQGSNRLAGFRPIDAYNPHIGEVAWLRNLTTEIGKPLFAPPERLETGGKAIVTFFHPEPCLIDLNRDGQLDLVVGSRKVGLRVFINEGSTDRPQFRDSGELLDENGVPIKSSLAARVEAADIDGDGNQELIASAYFGNQNRYSVYNPLEGRPLHYSFSGYLSIEAKPNTPVYGMGNSTIDPVDWDGDGDTDLLLGAEPGLPTIVENMGSETHRVFAAAKRIQFVDGAPIDTFSIDTGVGSYWGPGEWYSDRLTPRAADWNEDGVLDMVSGSMGRRLYFFAGRRIGGELRFERPKLFRFDDRELEVPDRIQPGLVDWNNDGKLDLLVTHIPGEVVVYLGDGSIQLRNPEILRLTNGDPLVIDDYWNRKKGNRSSLTRYDWDNDGLQDLLVYQFHKGVYLYRNGGGNRFEAARLLVPLYSHNAGVSVFDWDNDSIPDLLIGGDERRMIEPKVTAHLAIFHGEDTLWPPRTR